MVKVGLIGEGIDKSILQKYPLMLNQVVFVNENAAVASVLEGELLDKWIADDSPDSAGENSYTNAAIISLLLQAIHSYEDVSLSIVQVPLYPPEVGMRALSTALEWMTDKVQPGLLHIGFSSTEGKHQKQQNEWTDKLYSLGCKIVCPVGILPAFPASLNHITSVADQGFIEAGFNFSNPDIIIEEKEVAVYTQGTWVKQPVSNEIASALVLSNMIRERLVSSTSKTDNLVQLPSLTDLEYPAYEQPEDEVAPFAPAKPGLFQKVKLFVKSLLSRLLTPSGKVPTFIKDTRKISCNGDGADIRACDFRIESRVAAGAFVCGACGCGDREGVFVNGPVPKFEKLDYPYISCPASMPGFSNYLPSEDESQPSARKVAIEARFGLERLAKEQAVQKKLTDRLDKRLNWLDRL
ncbi:MAG: hypothetical protein Roseis2KO_30490 [Roseivirga sp.]